MDDQQVPAALRQRLEKKLSIGTRAVYKRIARISRSQTVSPRAAAFLLANEIGVGYTQWATAADRAEMRGHAGAAPQRETRNTNTDSPTAPRAAAARAAPRVKSPKATRNNSIFVVHGRDAALNADMHTFLRAIGIVPFEWTQAIKAAKGANPHVDEVIYNAMKKVHGVLVLLSPDEEAKLRPTFVSPTDRKKGLHALDGQPRPNVIFEAGLALGAHSEKTLLVQVGDIREISDIAGKHMVHLSNDPVDRKELAQRLRTKLKFKVDTTGNEWLKVGNFDR